MLDLQFGGEELDGHLMLPDRGRGDDHLDLVLLIRIRDPPLALLPGVAVPRGVLPSWWIMTMCLRGLVPALHPNSVKEKVEIGKTVCSGRIVNADQAEISVDEFVRSRKFVAGIESAVQPRRKSLLGNLFHVIICSEMRLDL